MTAEQLHIEFVKMVSSHSSLIYKVCNAYATGSYEMNDLYQDILLNLWRSYPSFRGESNYQHGFTRCLCILRSPH